MKKRGQITYFMLTGLVLIIIIGFVLYLYSGVNIKQQSLPAMDEVRNLVQDCLDEELIKAKDNRLLKQGMAGLSIEEGNELWKKNIEERINQRLPECLDFNVFSGLQIFFDDITMDITLLGYEVNTYFVLEAIQVDAEIPITIKKGKDTYKIRKFYTMYEAK